MKSSKHIQQPDLLDGEAFTLMGGTIREPETTAPTAPELFEFDPDSDCIKKQTDWVTRENLDN